MGVCSLGYWCYPASLYWLQDEGIHQGSRISTEYIVRTDTVAKTDSVYLKDSVYVFQKGDTVVISKIAYRDRYHNIYKVIRHDSIEVPVPCERTLTKSEQRLMTLGRCYIAFLFLVVVVGIGFTLWYHNKKC